MKNLLFRNYELSDYRTFGLESSHRPLRLYGVLEGSVYHFLFLYRAPIVVQSEVMLADTSSREFFVMFFAMLLCS